jgi:hypothetical protein
MPESCAIAPAAADVIDVGSSKLVNVFIPWRITKLSLYPSVLCTFWLFRQMTLPCAYTMRDEPK